MKYFLSIQSVTFIILLLFTHVHTEEFPAWWKQVYDEAQIESYSLITTGDLKKLYKSEKQSFLVVDVRTSYEHAEGHLPGAVNFEFDPGDKLQLKPGKKEAFLKLLGPDKDRKIVFYCRSFR